MSIDTIGDFLTIIRNGIMASKSFVLIPHSNVKFEIGSVLHAEGFINDCFVVEENNRKYIKVYLRYVDSESALHEIKRVSTPSRRFYVSANNIKPVVGGLGLSILTTNRGILSHKQAKKLNVGGEVICTVW